MKIDIGSPRQIYDRDRDREFDEIIKVVIDFHQDNRALAIRSRSQLALPATSRGSVSTGPELGLSESTIIIHHAERPFIRMVVDGFIYVFCFLFPGLDLYGALALSDPHESTRKALPVLRHFIVAVAFRTITILLDIFYRPYWIYGILKLFCVFGLIYGKHYDGSSFVYRQGLRTLASRFPMVVEFAEMSPNARVYNARTRIRAAATKFREEYERIITEIED
jgi:hypothetical protein